MLRASPLLAVLALACGGPADDLGSSSAATTATGGASTSSGSTGDAPTSTVEPDSTTGPRPTGPTGPPRILDLGASLTAMTEGDTVVITATLDDPDGDEDIADGELRRTDDDATVLATFEPADSGRWVATLTWTTLVVDGALSFAGATDVELTATFTDLDGHRADATTSFTLFCGGLAGGACAGACVDLDSDASHCGGCDQPCPTGCQAGTCPPS